MSDIEDKANGTCGVRIGDRARSAMAVLLAGITVVLGGCPQPPPRPEAVVPREIVIAEYNDRAAAIPRLWARARMQVHLEGPEGTVNWGSTLGLSNAILILEKGSVPLGPHNLFLQGKEAGQTVFQLGATLEDQVYYYWYDVFGRERGGIVVPLALADSPEAQRLPVDPLQILSMLCVTALPATFTDLPVVGMTIDESDPFERAYVLTYVDRTPPDGSIGFRREMLLHWSVDEPRLPFRIHLLDRRGVRTVTADVGDWEPIDVSAEPNPPANPPMMPTKIDITFPESGSWIRLRLSKMTTDPEVFDPDVFLLWEWLPFERRLLRVIGSPPPPTPAAEENPT